MAFIDKTHKNIPLSRYIVIHDIIGKTMSVFNPN